MMYYVIFKKQTKTNTVRFVKIYVIVI